MPPPPARKEFVLALRAPSYSGFSTKGPEEKVRQEQQRGIFAAGRIESGVRTPRKGPFFTLAFYS